MRRDLGLFEWRAAYVRDDRRIEPYALRTVRAIGTIPFF